MNVRDIYGHHPNCTFHWRRGGDWDVEAQRAAVEEWDQDPFLLYVLEAIQRGTERCGGCRKTFTHTRDVALITEWFESEPIRIEMVSYCLRCADANADAIADMTDHQKNA